jgi:hypothetical protein
MKRLNPVVEKHPQNFHVSESPLEQSPDDLQQGLQPMQVSSSHIELPVGMGDGMVTRKGGEQRVGVIPQ